MSDYRLYHKYALTNGPIVGAETVEELRTTNKLGHTIPEPLPPKAFHVVDLVQAKRLAIVEAETADEAIDQWGAMSGVAVRDNGRLLPMYYARETAPELASQVEVLALPHRAVLRFQTPSGQHKATLSLGGERPYQQELWVEGGFKYGDLRSHSLLHLLHRAVWGLRTQIKPYTVTDPQRQYFDVKVETKIGPITVRKFETGRVLLLRAKHPQETDPLFKMFIQTTLHFLEVLPTDQFNHDMVRKAIERGVVSLLEALENNHG